MTRLVLFCLFARHTSAPHILLIVIILCKVKQHMQIIFTILTFMCQYLTCDCQQTGSSRQGWRLYHQPNALPHPSHTTVPGCNVCLGHNKPKPYLISSHTFPWFTKWVHIPPNLNCSIFPVNKLVQMSATIAAVWVLVWRSASELSLIIRANCRQFVLIFQPHC